MNNRLKEALGTGVLMGGAAAIALPFILHQNNRINDIMSVHPECGMLHEPTVSSVNSDAKDILLAQYLKASATNSSACVDILDIADSSLVTPVAYMGTLAAGEQFYIDCRETHIATSDTVWRITLNGHEGDVVVDGATQSEVANATQADNPGYYDINHFAPKCSSGLTDPLPPIK